MMYSPEVGGRAPCEAHASIDKRQTSTRRFIIFERSIYAGRRIAQVAHSRAGAALPSFYLTAHQILPGLLFSNQRKLVAAHQDFRRKRSRIVIGSPDKSVRACAQDRQQ